MKTSVVLLLFLFILCLLPATQSFAQQNNFLDNFMDNKRTGLWAGAELGAQFGSMSIRDALLRFKLGYAPSENLGFYLASDLTDLLPNFGAMVFLEKYPGVYLNGSIGLMGFNAIFFKSNLYLLHLSMGYEFHPHVTAEAGIRYFWGSLFEIPVSGSLLSVTISYLFY